jgi:hypothetical protein
MIKRKREVADSFALALSCGPDHRLSNHVRPRLHRAMGAYVLCSTATAGAARYTVTVLGAQWAGNC